MNGSGKAPSDGQRGTPDGFECTRCDREDPQPLTAAPFADERGARIQAAICAGCWEDWKRRQMLLINHYGLNVRDAKARAFLYRNLDAFLFGGGEAAEIDTSKEGDVSW